MGAEMSGEAAHAERAQHEIQHGKFLAGKGAEMNWGWGTPAGFRRKTRRAELISKGATLGPDLMALEIGCGTGIFTEMFARTGARITAVDISEDLLEKAKERNLPTEDVCFLKKRFEDFDVNERFDAVIGSSVLHHLELEQALPKIHEILKPGGVISFAEPNILNPQVFLERKFRK
ncbi:MAG: class I SAM-dependent methyltransferase, partial [bacterium]|nr:class I SAM-dependent methyltransferase [bacterium]